MPDTIVDGWENERPHTVRAGAVPAAAFLDRLNDGVLIARRTGPARRFTVDYVNRAFCELIGMPADGLLGHSPLRLIRAISNADARRRLARALRAGGASTIEFKGREVDGKPVRVALDLVPNAASAAETTELAVIGRRHIAQGTMAGGAGIELVERRLVDAIESISEGFVIYDPDDRLVMCNEKMRQMYPSRAHRMVAGAKYEDLIRLGATLGEFAGVDDVDAYIATRLRTHRAPSDTTEVAMADGRRILVSERRTGDGGFVAVHSDVTEAKEREGALVAAKDEAEAANRTKSQFLANVSHELRTPLNAIIGFSEILDTKIFGPVGHPKYADYVRDIHESGMHLLELINDILDMAKIEAGKMTLAEEHFDLVAVIEDCLRKIAPQVRATRQTVTRQFDDNLPSIVADRRAIRQIMLNLLSNAVKFTPAGGRITVSAHADAGGLVIAVADTGIGIRAAELERVLRPFEQAQGALVREHQGTGLGLPVTKSLVELHDGTLELDSSPGEGTTVTIRLPRHRALASVA